MQKIAVIVLLCLFLGSSLFAQEQNYKIDCTTIRSCLLRAIKSNLDLKVEGYNPKLAAYDIIVAESVFDPNLSARYTYVDDKPVQFSDLNPTTAELSSSFTFGLSKANALGGNVQLNYNVSYLNSDNNFIQFDRVWQNQIEVRASQPLLRNMGVDVNTSAIRIAKNDHDTSLYAFQGKALQVLTSVQTAYLDLVNARENYELQRESLRLSQNLYKITEARIKAGTLAAADILDAERDIAFKQDSLILADRQVAATEDILKQLINPLDVNYYKTIRLVPTDRPVFNPIGIDFDKSLKHALENRVDIKQLKKQLENANIDIGFQKNQLLPEFNIEAGIQFGGVGEVNPDAAKQVTNLDFPRWDVLVSLNIPLGNRSAEAKYKRSLTQKKQLKAEMERLKSLVILEIRNTVLDLDTASKRVRTARIARDLAEKQLINEENKYRAGIIALFQVQDTEQKLTEAKINEINTIIAYQKSIVQLEKAEGALGRSLKRYNIRLGP